MILDPAFFLVEDEEDAVEDPWYPDPDFRGSAMAEVVSEDVEEDAFAFCCRCKAVDLEKTTLRLEERIDHILLNSPLRNSSAVGNCNYRGTIVA